MEFKNLGCNILDILSDNRNRSGTLGPFRTISIYGAFSDIPKQNVAAALFALDHDGFLMIHDKGQKLTLTLKGIAKIEIMQSCLKKVTQSKTHEESGCCS